MVFALKAGANTDSVYIFSRNIQEADYEKYI